MADKPDEPKSERTPDSEATTRKRGNLRLLPKPLAYCRPDNDNGERAC